MAFEFSPYLIMLKRIEKMLEIVKFVYDAAAFRILVFLSSTFCPFSF